MSWEIKFKKAQGIDNDSYLEEFLKQAESKISGLSIETTVKTFESQLSNWEGYKKYYVNDSMYISRGAYMDIDELVSIHNSSQHVLDDAYEPTKNTVFDVYRNKSNEKLPMIPFVLKPSDFKYVTPDSEFTISYNILKEGRSRLSGVVKAREEGNYSKDIVPVLFAIRRTRR